jgi:hypothetical protein
MSDPQDLLYTNRFVSENILSDKQLTDETKYYDRFKNYIDNEKDSEIEKYINNDTLESSPINLNKTLNRKWPITNNRNHYPLFDTYINDISSNTYRKEVITKVNIDSSNRDLSRYFYPNKFSIPFPKVFNNIKSVVLNDICIIFVKLIFYLLITCYRYILVDPWAAQSKNIYLDIANKNSTEQNDIYTSAYHKIKSLKVSSFK